MQRSSMVILYGVSLALHASLGMGVTEIEPEKEPERVAITVVTPPPKPKPKVEEPPPPPPPPPPPVAEAPKKAPKAKAAEPPPPVAAPVAAPTFGIAMTGGVGMGGIAIPQGDGLAAPREAPAKRVAEAKTLVEPKKPKGDVCDEPPSKPKLIGIESPAYTEEARAANIEGKVRVEVIIDENGLVKSVRVLEPLGHGLDEAAVRAAKTATFQPAMHCGKAVSATVPFGIRFAL